MRTAHRLLPALLFLLALAAGPTGLAEASPSGQWSPVPVPGGERATDLARSGDRVLVGANVLDTSNLLRPWRARVFLSEDGGRTFAAVEGALGQEAAGDPVAAVAFAGPALVVARGSDVFRSVDGGGQWSRGSAPATVRALHFVDAATGFAVGDGGMIARTDDAGATFVALESSTGVALRGQEWIDDLHGWAWGHDEQRRSGPGESGVEIGAGVLVRTTDGGASWGEVHRFSGRVVGPARFIGPADGFVVEAERLVEDGLRAVAALYRTADGGNTLEQVALPEEVGTLRAPIGPSSALRIAYIPGVAFDDRRHGRLAALVHLMDSQSSSGGGGQQTTERQSSFRLLDLTTEDGGETWAYAPLGELSASFSGVDGPDDGRVLKGLHRHANEGLLLGEDGRVWRWEGRCAEDADCLGPSPCSAGTCGRPSAEDYADAFPDGVPEDLRPDSGGDRPADRPPRRIPGEESGSGGCAAAPPSGQPLTGWVPLLLLALLVRRRHR